MSLIGVTACGQFEIERILLSIRYFALLHFLKFSCCSLLFTISQAESNIIENGQSGTSIVYCIQWNRAGKFRRVAVRKFSFF